MAIGGVNQRIAYAIESTYGTDPGTGYRSIGEVQADPTFTADNALVPVSSAGNINTRAILLGSKVVGAKVDWFVQDAAFIIAALGDYDTTSPVTNGSNYKHMGGTEDSTSTCAAPVEYKSKSFSLMFGLENGGTDDVIKLTGCKVNSLTLTLSLNEPLRASADIYAQTAIQEDSLESYSQLCTGPYMYHNKGTINVNSESVANLTNLAVTVNNNMKRTFSAGGGDGVRTVDAILQGTRTVEGTITINYSDYQQFGSLFDAGTEFETNFLLDNSETTTAAAYRGVYGQILRTKLGTRDKRLPLDGSAVEETYNISAEGVRFSDFDENASDPF